MDFERIIEESPSSVYVTDGTGRTLLVNKAYEVMTGVPRGEVLGKNVAELEKEGYFRPSAILLALEKKSEISLVQVQRNGIQALVSATPIFDDKGKIVFVVSNTRTINFLHTFRGAVMTQDAQEKPEIDWEDWIVHESPQTNEILALLRRVAQVDSTVLLLGESGTGKSLFAKYLHNQSARRGNPLVEINCAAIPESLLESELFGYTKGAFTGANERGKKGLVEIADQGTLFLDEIGEMSLGLQGKLLQLMQDKSFMKIGAEKAQTVDLKIICATNKDLYRLVEEGRFREDLYYRINVVPITIPPLRERKEDIPLLIEAFLNRYNQKFGRHVSLSENDIRELVTRRWPGNVRELENYIERLVIAGVRETMPAGDAGEAVKDPSPKISESKEKVCVTEILPYETVMEEAKKQLFRLAYEKYGSSYKVAEALGISQSNANRNIQKYVTQQQK